MDWMQPAVEIAIAALVSSLILLVEHYAPGGPKNNVVFNYILGVLALILPLSGLMLLWGLWPVVIAIWAIVAAGGLTVMAAYAIDSYIAMVQRVKAAELENKLLRPEIEHGSND